MNSDMLINNLAALLIITSLLVIAVKNSKAVTFWYAHSVIGTGVYFLWRLRINLMQPNYMNGQ